MARIIRSFLGLIFILAGVSCLAGNQGAVALFQQIGLGDWLRYVAGIVAVSSGALLLLPSSAIAGSAIATSLSLSALLFQAFMALGSPLMMVVLTFLSGGSLVHAQLEAPIATHKR